jgi:hypothetical protein
MVPVVVDAAVSVPHLLVLAALAAIPIAALAILIAIVLWVQRGRGQAA